MGRLTKFKVIHNVYREQLSIYINILQYITDDCMRRKWHIMPVLVFSCCEIMRDSEESDVTHLWTVLLLQAKPKVC